MFVLSCVFSTSAQVGYGLRYAGGMYYFNGSTYDDVEIEPYASDKDMSDYISQFSLFGSYTKKKMTYRADAGLFFTKNTEWGDKPVKFYNALSVFKEFENQKEIRYRTISHYYMGSVGLSAAYHLNEKWRIGAGVNYLFDLGVSEQTVSAIDQAQNTTKKEIGFIGYEMPEGGVPSALINVSYLVKKQIALTFETQMNLKSLNTVSDYYFLMFNLGVSYNFGK
jgi:hypothetical protein